MNRVSAFTLLQGRHKVGVEASTLTPSAPWAISPKSECYWAGWEDGHHTPDRNPAGDQTLPEAYISNLCGVFKKIFTMESCLLPFFV